MKRKISIIIIALAVVIFINELDIFGVGGFGGFMNFLSTILIGYRAFVLFRRANHTQPSFSTKPIARSQPALPQYRTTDQEDISPIKRLQIVLLIFAAVFILFAYQTVGAGAFNFFVWGDHVLGGGDHPVFLWALLGLPCGTVLGAFIIWRKYHTPFRWCLASIVPLLSTLIILQTTSSPLGIIEPRPLIAATDTAKQAVADTTPLVIPKKKHQSRQAKLIETAKQDTTDTGCKRSLGEISINARSDSVNIYYRTTNYLHGPWSAWRSKFVPQSGQFSLTEEGSVRANSLQYYYESRSVQTRSAQNPYNRALCDGPLVIDTY